ncbi:MAG: hypothetical protein ACYS74_23780 [Planctomycetota bacterium]
MNIEIHRTDALVARRRFSVKPKRLALTSCRRSFPLQADPARLRAVDKTVEAVDNGLRQIEERSSSGMAPASMDTLE